MDKDNLSIESKREEQLPSSVEAERVLLGAMMFKAEVIPKLIETLQPEAFFDVRNQVVFGAMISLFEQNETIDSVSISLELTKRSKLDLVGTLYINQLVQDVYFTVNIESYLNMVLKKWQLRKLIISCKDIIDKASTEKRDVRDLLDEIEVDIYKIFELKLTDSYKSMDYLARELLEYIESRHQQKSSFSSGSTGFHFLDDILGGFYKSNLIILAARTSMVKIAFSNSVILKLAGGYKLTIAVFSLEVNAEQVGLRLISTEAKVNLHKVMTGKFNNSEAKRISQACRKLSQSSIFINDTQENYVSEIRVQCKRLKAEKNVGLIIIDNLQSISSYSSRSETDKSHVMSRLKIIAYELNVPVIVISNLNDDIENRNDKRPALSDIDEYNSFKKDVDVVLLLNRPEFYGITKFPDGESTEGVAELIIAKNRNGTTGDVRLKFIKEYGRFENLDIFHSSLENNNNPPSLPEDDLPI